MKAQKLRAKRIGNSCKQRIGKNWKLEIANKELETLTNKFLYALFAETLGTCWHQHDEETCTS